MNYFRAITCFAILLVWSFLFCPSVAIARGDLNQKIGKAVELLNAGKARAAASILQGVLSSQNDNASAHMVLGAALAAQVDDDHYDAAIAEEEQALKLDPSSYGARKILGQIYANLHKTQESISILTDACSMNPKSYAALRDLGVAQMTAGKTDEAIQTFLKACQLNPSKTDPHVKLSALYLKKENHKEAIAEGKKAIKTDVANPEGHLALANAMLASGDKVGSIEYFESAMQANLSKEYRNPLTQASALSGLGWAFSGKDAGKKELDEAVNDQREAIHLFPAFGPAYVRLAELLSRQGRMKEADAVYKTSVKLSQEDSAVSTAYARFLLRTKRSDEARSLLRKILEKDPHYKPASDELHTLDNEKAS